MDDPALACLVVLLLIAALFPFRKVTDRKPHNFTCPCCMRRAEFSSRHAAMQFSQEHLRHCKLGAPSSSDNQNPKKGKRV